jgi:hypothetical protein
MLKKLDSFELTVPNSRIDARADFFSARVINVWNSLSDEIFKASNISSFNSILLTMDLSTALHGKKLCFNIKFYTLHILSYYFQ